MNGQQIKRLSQNKGKKQNRHFELAFIKFFTTWFLL